MRENETFEGILHESRQKMLGPTRWLEIDTGRWKGLKLHLGSVADHFKVGQRIKVTVDVVKEGDGLD